MVSGYPTNVRGDVNAGGAGGGYYGGQYGVDLTTGQNGEGEGLSSQNVVGYGGGGGYGQVPPQGVLQGVSQGTPQGSLEGTHQRVPGYGGVGGYGQIPAQGVAQGGGYYGRDVYGQMGGYNGTEVNAGMNVGGGGEGQMGGDGAPVRPLQAQMESLSLGGRPMPTGYVQQSVPTPQMPGGGMMASGEPAVLPRPKFDSISVLARLNDLDAKSPMPVGSMQQSQQMDAYGRPIPGTVSQGPGRWPPTVACPPEMFYPPSPRCARMTTNAFPNSLSLAKKYGLPMGVVIQPMEDGDQLPVVNFGKAGVVRCRRCRSYVNYMCRFINDGRSWRCSLCQFVNDIPKEYWCGVDQHGHRHDVGKRPELICGSYEIVAPTSYMLRPPMGPTYMFVLEVTTAAVTSGLLSAAATGIRESLDLLPNDARTRVGLITFDSTLQFYRFKTDGSGEASMVVMPDVSDVFLPAPDQILVSLQEARSAFDQLLERLPSIHGSAAQPQPDGQISSPAANSAFGSAIIAAQSVLEGPGGRIVAIVSTRPKIGVGALKDRSDNTSLGTDRERVLLSPDNPFYKQKAVELQRFYISVDLIICPPAVGSFFDVATVAPLAKYTGGEIIYNPSFDIQRDGHLLVETLKRILGRETAWESVMRIRASKGVCCSTFHGRFFLKTTDLLALPNVDPDKTFAVEFKYDENVLEHQVFCIQIALLYTTSAGERRIRVHTTSVPIVTSLADLFLATDAQATTHLISRRAAETLRDKRLDDVRKTITDPLVNALAAYRNATHSQYNSTGLAAGGMILPESLYLFPLLLQGILKTPLFTRDSYGLFGYRTDDKAALLHTMNVVSTSTVSAMAYPTVLPLFPLYDYPDAGVYTEDENGVTGVTLPPALPVVMATLEQDKVLLVDDGCTSIVWIGVDAHASFCGAMVGSAPQNDLYGIGTACLYGGPDGDGGRVRAIVRNVRGLRRAGAPLHIVPQGTAMQARVEALMVEEQTASQVGYREFLADIQKQVNMRSAKG